LMTVGGLACADTVDIRTVAAATSQQVATGWKVSRSSVAVLERL
jgi:hypothetical protein